MFCWRNNHEIDDDKYGDSLAYDKTAVSKTSSDVWIYTSENITVRLKLEWF